MDIFRSALSTSTACLVGTNCILVMTALIMSLGHIRQDVFTKEILERGILLLPPDRQHDLLKKYTTAAKRSGKNPDGDLLEGHNLTSVCYLELAFGRAQNTTDWDKKIKNRSSGVKHLQMPNLKYDDPVRTDFLTEFEQAENKPEDPELYHRLKLKFAEDMECLLGGITVLDGFEEFAKRRHEWAASGSSAGKKITISAASSLVRDSNKSIKAMRIGKRGYFEMITWKDLDDALRHTKPIEFARASEKYENGKSRAIYGVESFHYSINTYASRELLDHVNKLPGVEKGATGLTVFAQERHRCALTKDEECEQTMMDYSDFNVQHTPTAQALLFEAAANYGERHQFHLDWVAANRWVAEAKYNSWFTIPGDDMWHKAEQGMFSGTRTTDLINTLCNRNYVLLAKGIVAEVFGLHPEAFYHVHQGDDLWISNKKRHWAAMMFYVLMLMGLIFYPIKQMFGHQRGEFLRIYYDHGRAMGYSVRCIVNYLLRPLQNESDCFLEQWTRTLSASYATMHRRGIGFNVLNTFYDTDVFYYARIMAHARDEAPVCVPYHILVSDPISGGLGCPRPGTISISRSPIPEIPIMLMRPIVSDTMLPDNMSKDWIGYVTSKLPEFNHVVNYGNLKNVFMEANFADVLANYGKGPDYKRYKKEWSEYIIERVSNVNKSIRVLGRDSAVDTYLIDNCTTLEQMATMVMEKRMQFMRLGHTITDIRMKLVSLMPVRGSNDVRLLELLNMICTRSLFKDLSTAARALNLTKIEALMWIMLQNSTAGSANSTDYSYLNELVHEKRDDILDFLTSQLYTGLECLTYVQHPLKILSACNMESQTWQLCY